MPTNSTQAFAQLQQYQNKMQAPQAVMSAQEQQAGVPQAQQQVSGLRQAITNTTNLLNQIPQGVMGRTQNSLVTSAQANRQIQNESAPVAQNLQSEGQQYSEAQSNYDRLHQQAVDAANAQIQGQQQKYGNLKDIYGMLYGSEQDARARALENAKFALAKRSAGSGSGSPAFSFGGGSTGATGAAGQTGQNQALQQAAYNDVRSRQGQSPEQLMSDYLATASSAKNGNQQDLYKLQVYRQLFPQQFKYKYPWEK